MKFDYRKFHRLFQFSLTSIVLLTTYNNCSKPMHSASGSDTSPSVTQQATFKCTDRNLNSKTKNYTLSRVQYLNTIEDLFGLGAITAASAQISTIGLDLNDPDTYQRLSSVDPSKVISYYEAAEAIATYITSNTTRVSSIFGACANNANPAVTCIDGYLNGFASKIFRRPLTANEISFAKNSIMTTSGAYKENLKALLTYHLSAPAFIWLLELGSPSSSGNRLMLTPYEVATRISYLITDSTPDAALYASAQDGSIMTPVGLNSQVLRLLQSPRGKKKIKANYLRWSLNDIAEDVSALPAQLINGVNTTGLKTAMETEADAFVDYILFQQQGSFNDLLTSKLSFASHTGLANIYGHTPISTTPAIMTQRRQGLLMRAPAYTYTAPLTSIIIRGVHFLKRTLCMDLPSPNFDITSARDAHVLTPQEILNTTNRAAITYQTSSTLCTSCHQYINPIGFTFEGFDPLGKIRNQELKFDMNGVYAGAQPIHTSTDVLLPSGRTFSVADAYDFVTQLSQGDEIKNCATRHAYRYFYEKEEKPEDDCILKDSFDIVTNPANSALSSIEKLFTHDKIYYKEL